MEVKNKSQTRKFTWGHSLKLDIDKTGQFIKKLHDLPRSCTDPDTEGSRIQEFFSGAHVFVTGSTGFMGKAIVEKLLASCPRLAKVYLLIREKKGFNVEKRLDDLFAEDIFVRVRATVPDFRKKVVGIHGDCSKLSLGMSEEDYEELSRKVNVIIHGAATVNFHETLRVSTLINVRGVREMVQFAAKCSSLKSMVHLSTAYSSAVLERSVVEEKFSAASINYKELIDIVDRNSEVEVEEMKEELIKGWPNTYCFTKLVAEGIIEEECQNIPLAVFRPAIVSPSYKEPVRGWCDNINGEIAVITGIWTGVLRTCLAKRERVCNIVPVDSAANCVLAVAYQTAQSFRTKERQFIYNYVSSERNSITWKDMLHWSFEYGRNWPTMSMIWYPKVITTLSLPLFRIIAFFLHTLPACLADTFLSLTGRKMRFFKRQRTLNRFAEAACYFAKNQWRFTDANTLKLWQSLSEKDKEIFPFDIVDVDWDDYCLSQLLGIRTYLLKDPPETIPAGRVRYRRLVAQHAAIVGAFTLSLAWTGFHLLSSVYNSFFLQ